MACCPARLVFEMHFPSRKIKKKHFFPYLAAFSIVCYVFTRLFIDIIMGNFRQHEKIYFTSCSSWSNFEWGVGKVYRGKLFFHRYRSAFSSGKGELFLSNFQVPTRFSTFSPRCCQHQFGCIKEKRRGVVERTGRNQNSIVDLFTPPQTQIRRIFRRWEGAENERAIKILKQWKNLISSAPPKWIPN